MRRLAAALAALSALGMAWSAITLVWGEPLTGVVHHAHVRELERRLLAEEAKAAGRPSRATRVPALPDGAPVGRLTGPRIDALVVMGRNASDLEKGPGLWNARPGRGGTTVISGHRTTYGAPFRHLDGLRESDRLRLDTPSGTFEYRVTRRRIVDPRDLSVTRDVGHEQLVLTACHPVYSAAQRIVVFADRIVREARRPTFG